MLSRRLSITFYQLIKHYQSAEPNTTDNGGAVTNLQIVSPLEKNHKKIVFH